MAKKPDLPKSDSRSQHLRRALELISAVAKRDAAPEEIVTPEEIVAQLRDQGIDSLDVLVAVLARAAKQSPAGHRRAERPIDIRRFSQPTPRELVAKIEHREPKMPFLLNGTLFDPKDIRRFNGSELHFLGGSSSNELLVFEDRNVIARLWEMTYLMGACYVGKPHVRFSLVKGQYGGSASDVAPQGGFVPLPPLSPPPGPEEFPSHPWPHMDKPGAYFYEDSGPEEWGECLFCNPNRGYYDLTKVGRGFLGAGDWNDVISAFTGFGVNIVVLHEHINMQGDSLTRFAESQLDHLGWNDRASSVACW